MRLDKLVAPFLMRQPVFIQYFEQRYYVTGLSHDKVEKRVSPKAEEALAMSHANSLDVHLYADKSSPANCTLSL